MILTTGKIEGGNKKIQTSKILFVGFLIAFSLTGCASLGEIVQDIQELDATTEITAVETLTNDLFNQPWDNIIQVGLGYLLCLIRRKYKISKGAK